jgi:isocitrate/isopropylmalate dehydrogenase
MMLRHLGEDKAALALDEAIRAVLKEGWRITRDLGGSATTREMADAIIDKLTGS